LAFTHADPTFAKLCFVEGCERIVTAKSLCTSHYQRVRSTGQLTPELPIGFKRQDPVCAVEVCGLKTYCKGLCRPHYRRLVKYGDPGASAIEPPIRQVEFCTVDGCENPTDARNLCQGHRQRLSAHGDTFPEVPLGFRLPVKRVRAARAAARSHCEVPGCENLSQGRGLCGPHKKRLQKYGNVRADVPIGAGRLMPKKIRSCSIDGCESRAASRGWCNRHLRLASVYGDPLAGPKDRARTDRRITTDGYVVVYRPSHPNANSKGDILEHRLIMSESLGRPLLLGENVHHKNGVKTDNRPDNLELWVRLQPAGQRVTDLPDWADEIIGRYRPSVAPVLTLAESEVS
jgi:hypothetical protein